MGGNIRRLAHLGNGRIGERDRVRRRGLHALSSIVCSRLQGYLSAFKSLMISGYLHESWKMEICRNRITKNENTEIDSQWHCQLQTYKQNPENGR